MSETGIKGWDDLKNYDLREAILVMNRQIELIEAEYKGALSVLKRLAEEKGVSTEKWNEPTALASLCEATQSIIIWINGLKEGLMALETRVENLEYLDKRK